MCTGKKFFSIVVTGLVFMLWGGFVNRAYGKIPVAHNEVLGLNKLEALLWERNPSLEIFRLRTRSAGANALEQKHLYGPTFHSRYSYHPDADAFNDAFTSSIHRGDFYMSYPLLDGIWRREHEYRRSKSMEDELSARTRMRWMDLLHRLRNYYLSALEAAELAAGFRKTAYHLSARIKPLQSRVAAQEALPVHLLELEKIIIEADVLRLEQEKTEIQARNAIASLISLKPKSFLLRQTDSISWGELPSEEELTEWACQGGAGLAVFSSKLMREKAASDAFFYRYLRLDATAGYTVEEDSVEGFESGSRFGLNFQIPVLYKELTDQRRIRRHFNEEALRKEIYAEQTRTQNQISSVYENLNWLKKKEKVIEKDNQRLGEILRIIRLKNDSPAGERRREDISEAEYRLWLGGVEKIRLRYERLRSLNRLLHLAEIPHFDQMRKIRSKHREKTRGKRSLALKITKNFHDWTDAEMEFLLFFLKTKGVDRVFWSVDRKFNDKNHSVVSKRIALLNQNDIRVIATLKIIKTSRKQTITVIEQLLDYNRNAGENERFWGVHLGMTASDDMDLMVSVRDRIEALQLSVNIPYDDFLSLSNAGDEGARKNIKDKMQAIFSLADEVVLEVHRTKQDMKKTLLKGLYNRKTEKIRIGIRTMDFLDMGGEAGIEELTEGIPCAGFLLNDYQGWRKLITSRPLTNHDPLTPKNR